MKPKVIWLSLIVLSVCIAVAIGIAIWENRNPLKQYGVTFEKFEGEHAEYQHLWICYEQNGKRVYGTVVIGEELQLEFKKTGLSNIPDIIIRSGHYETQFAVLRLNLSDQTKPEIELIANHGLGVQYPPPWEDYYKYSDKYRGQSE